MKEGVAIANPSNTRQNERRGGNRQPLQHKVK
jgi:hypothetical protein